MLAFLFVCCSPDENQNVFDSHILINGTEFTPDKNDDGDHFDVDGITTHAVTDTLDGHARARIFNLLRYDGPTGYSPVISVTVFYPREHAAIDGTYNFATGSTGTYHYVAGGLRNAQGFMVGFNDGSVTITSKGPGRYRLEFNSVKGNFISIPFDDITTVEGYFDGNFKNF